MASEDREGGSRGDVQCEVIPDMSTGDYEDWINH